MLLLEQILELPIMKTFSVVAGGDLKDIEVQSISVLEVPKATEFVKRNELLITSFYSISNDIDKQVDLLKSLKIKGVSGLIICHTGIVLKTLSDKLIKTCDEIRLPLIIAAPNISYYDIINPIMDILLEKKNYKLKSYLEIQNLFLKSMAKSRNVDSILTLLRKVINRNLFYLDYEFKCLYKSNFDNSDQISENLSFYIKSNLNEILNEEYRYIEIDSEWYITPVSSNKKFYGFLIIQYTCTFSELEKIAISQAKNSLSIISILQINMNEFLSSVKRNYLIELFFSNSILDANQILRGKKLGYNIENLRQALVIDVFKFNTIVLNSKESLIADFKKNLLQKVIPNISINQDKYIIFEYSDKIILLFYDDKNLHNSITCLKKLGNFIINSIKYELNIDVSVGIGLYYNDYKKIINSINEAIVSVKLSNRIYGEPRCTNYKDIAVYDLVLNNINRNDAINVIKDLLFDIIHYDKLNDTDLLSTIRVLFKFANNTVLAANSLYVHKNTILQRKRKIVELIGEDPFNVENYSKYNLAILLMDYFEITIQSFDEILE